MSIRSFLNVHRKSIIAFLSVAVIFIITALIPLAAKKPYTEPAVITQNFAQDAALFADYWARAENGYEVFTYEDISSQKEQECTEFFEHLRSESYIDNQEGELTDQGVEYIVVQRGDSEINLCNMWYQTVGDWSNWTWIVFDINTQFVYHFYYSSVCVDGTYHGISQYTFLTVDRMAADIGTELGYELADLEKTINQTQTLAKATYIKDGSFLKMDISFNYIENSLVDLEITCAPYNAASRAVNPTSSISGG